MIFSLLTSLLYFALVSILLLILGAPAAAVYVWSTSSELERNHLRLAIRDTKEYWGCLWFFSRGGRFSDCPFFTSEDEREVRVRIFGIALTFWLWSKPHYRHGTFQDDLKKNLRNVAVPGTGIPLSAFAFAKPFAYVLMFVLYPMFNIFSATNVGQRNIERICEEYRDQLLRPTHWFGLWRLNCALASYHSLITAEKAYELEDKLTFLQVAEKNNIAVSPYLSMPAIICKHRNEEGGLGYMFYSNAVAGGDWIIQEVLCNDSSLANLLPANAPLSTFRVITISTFEENKVSALSCVWRAGLSGAKTDHAAILFDVDRQKQQFKKGVTNGHWYKLGPGAIFTTKWSCSFDIDNHPDNGKRIAGESLAASDIVSFAEEAHKRLMPGVPIVGWDVALTNKGMLMLECNLSCNFFLGSFDLGKYFSFVEEYFLHLESVMESRDQVKREATGDQTSDSIPRY